MGPFEVFLVWGRFVDGSKWLRSNLSTTPYDLTPTGQRGKLYEKNIFIFDFHILPEHRRIGEKFFPCRCISIKNGDQPWGRCWPIYQLGAAANFDDLVKFGDRRQIRRSQMFIKLAFEFGCDVIFMSYPITRSLGNKLRQTSIFAMKYSFFTNQTGAVW